MNIHIPIIGMMFLTLIVWLVMYIKRLSWVVKNRVSPNKISTPEKIGQHLPESVNHAANNFKNLFEMPVIFYVLCLLMELSGLVDAVQIYCAYLFFVTRCIHSVIQCTSNRVVWRFYVYMFSSTVLWLMVVRYAMSYIG